MTSLDLAPAPMPPARPQMLVFSYHKSGTTLFLRVMTKIAAAFGLKLANQYGLVTNIDPAADIVLLPHALLGFELGRPFRAIRVVRDPRDIWVSSYLYHLRCGEAWCRNSNFDPTPPIVYPRVDLSVQHRSERWKRSYLASLGGQSYQQNLLTRDRNDGLRFEYERYTAWTLEAMRGWRLDRPEVRDVQLETIAAQFDATMPALFRHLGFNSAECAVAMDIAITEDVSRMSDAAIAADEHIHSRAVSKWRDHLTAEQVAQFEQRHADLITALGYTLSRPAV